MPWETEGGICAEKGGLYAVSLERAIVGRFGNLLWVALTTYSRFFGRPTVGRFLGWRSLWKKEKGALHRRVQCPLDQSQEDEGEL